MEFSGALKIFIVLTIVYTIMALLFYDSVVMIRPPTPPAMPSDTLGMIKWFFSMIGYYIGYIATTMINAVSLITFPFIPMPWRIIIAIPLNGLYVYSLIIIVRDIINMIKDVVGGVRYGMV